MTSATVATKPAAAQSGQSQAKPEKIRKDHSTRNISICHVENISSLLKFSQILRCKNRKFRTGPVGKAIRCRIQVIRSVKTGKIRICKEPFYDRLFVIKKSFQQGKLLVSNCKNATVAFFCFSKSIFLFL